MIIFFNLSFYDKQLCKKNHEIGTPSQVKLATEYQLGSSWFEVDCLFFQFQDSIFILFQIITGMIRTVQQVRYLPNESTRHWRNFSRMIFTPTENIASMQVWGRNLSWEEMKKSTEISQMESWSLCSNCCPTKKAENAQWYRCFKFIDHPNSSTMRSIFHFIIRQAFSFLVCFTQHHRFKSLQGMWRENRQAAFDAIWNEHKFVFWHQCSGDFHVPIWLVSWLEPVEQMYNTWKGKKIILR